MGGAGRALRVVVTAVAVVAVLVAIVDAYWITTGSDCPINPAYDPSGNEVLERRALPPKVVCRYEYRSASDGSTVRPPEVEVHDSAPSWIVAAAATALAAVVSTVARRRAERGEDGPR